MAGDAWLERSAPGWQAEHRRIRQRRPHRDSRWACVHRRHERSAVPRVRFENRKGTLGIQARPDCQCESAYVSGQERQAVRSCHRKRFDRRVFVAVNNLSRELRQIRERWLACLASLAANPNGGDMSKKCLAAVTMVL